MLIGSIATKDIDVRARLAHLDDIIATETNVIHRLMYIQERINLREKLQDIRIQDIHHRRKLRT